MSKVPSWFHQTAEEISPNRLVDYWDAKIALSQEAQERDAVRSESPSGSEYDSDVSAGKEGVKAPLKMSAEKLAELKRCERLVRGVVSF